MLDFWILRCQDIMLKHLCTKTASDKSNIFEVSITKVIGAAVAMAMAY